MTKNQDIITCHITELFRNEVINQVALSTRYTVLTQLREKVNEQILFQVRIPAMEILKNETN